MDAPDQTPKETIDITGEVCPMTFVRTKLKLERMQPGEVLSVRLIGEEPLRNVPRAACDGAANQARHRAREAPPRRQPLQRRLGAG